MPTCLRRICIYCFVLMLLFIYGCFFNKTHVSPPTTIIAATESFPIAESVNSSEVDDNAPSSDTQRHSALQSLHIAETVYRRRWSDALARLERNDGDMQIDELDRKFLSGYINLQLGNYTAAESLFTYLLGVQYDLNDWTAIFLTQAAYRNGSYETAFMYSRNAGKIPGLVDTVGQIRWRSLWETGKHRNAIAQLDTLQQQGFMEKWECEYHKGACYRKIGEYSRAKKILRPILMEFMGNSEKRWLVILSANEYARIDSLNDDDFGLLGKSYYYARSYSDAIKWLGRYSKSETIAQLRYLVAVSYANTGLYKTALIRFNNLLKDNAYERSTIWWRIGYCHRKMGNLEKAKVALDSAAVHCRKKCGNKMYILKERMFTARDTDDMHGFAVEAVKIAAANPGGATGSAGLIWAILGYIDIDAPDTAAHVAKVLRSGFKSDDFLDEIRYWEAVALTETGDTCAADSICKYIARSPRFNLFAWLARNKLGLIELPHPGSYIDMNMSDEADSIWLDGKTAIEEILGKSLPPPGILKNDPILYKAQHLAKMGLIWLAEPCFKAIQKEATIGKKTEEVLELWRMYYSLGLYHMASQQGRILCQYFGKKPELLRMQYLTPFRDEVDERCREEGIDPYFLYATMFQESRFNPHAVSYANAMGLMQFIESTGENVAGWLNIRDFETNVLFDYETSISLGARLLSYLLRHRASPYLALAEYNAGDKRTNRWADQCTDIDSDVMCAEFFDIKQTRLYAKQVMGHYYTYHWIYGGMQHEHGK